MFFDSPIYFVFLTAVVLVYWQLDRYRQNIFLLAASYFFYGWWDWRFLTLVFVSTVVDFYLAHVIARSSDEAHRFRTMMISIVLNVGFLAYFKYANFFVDSMVDALNRLGVEAVHRPMLELLLPPGISFYTFQAIAYIVDVHDRRVKPANSLVDYALFISLFPHLVAGPIQRPDHLLPQVEESRAYDADRVQHGLMLIAWGLFRKCVIADNCALVADAAFSGKLGPPSLPVLALGAYAFAWQIYGDFSGYSQIARGSALLMGFDFMINFRQPHLATSLQDFWRRWHISLSQWLRDYVYIRLGGGRNGELQTSRNLMATMLIGGFWHGAAWTYILWGGIHGAGLAIGRAMDRAGLSGAERQRSPTQEFIRRWLLRALVFHIVALALVIFRSPSIGSAFSMLAGAATLDWEPGYAAAFLFLGIFAGAMLAVDLVNERDGTEYPFEKMTLRQLAPSAVAVLLAVAIATGNNSNAFIYFQF